MSDQSYVYTLGAAAARLRRGANEVLMMWPNSGHLVKITKNNLSEMRRLFRLEFLS